MIKITTIENGYLISDSYETFYEIEEEIEGKKVEAAEIITCVEEDLYEENNGALKKVLEIVAEKLGYEYNKWGENNLNITFDKKGHKL